MEGGGDGDLRSACEPKQVFACKINDTHRVWEEGSEGGIKGWKGDVRGERKKGIEVSFGHEGLTI